MKKVIISYASAGAGHFKAAQAIYDYLKKERPDLEVKMVDALMKSGIFFRQSYIFGYPLLVKYLQWIWRFLFWLTHIKFLRPVTRGIVSFANRIATKRFADFLINENPDFIVSTHFLTSEISAHLKKTGRINSHLVTVITDFGMHPFWLSKETDLYIVSSATTCELLIGEGIEPERIKCFGIPVGTEFWQHYSKERFLKKFNLKEDKFNVLIVTGSFGIGPIEKIIKVLYKEVQILVVCARNHKLYRKLKNKNYPNCLVLGFVDNIQELMAVSDVIITKPGGMSISESLVMGLIPIFISPIPGQETENVEVLKRQGIGIYPKGIAGIKNIVLELKQNPDKLTRLKQDISAFIKPYAVRDISDVIR